MSRRSSLLHRKRFIKVTIVIIAVIAFIILGLQLWLVHNARDLLKDIVLEKSDSTLKLELSRVRFNFFTNRLQVREADLVSTDSATQPVTYHVKFRKLTLRLRSFWPLLFENKLLLDSIKLHDPDIQVVQWRKDVSAPNIKDDLSISQEMGMLYNSMLDVLDAFGIRRIIVNNAKVSLVNKMKPGAEAITVSNIYLNLFRTASDTNKTNEFVQNKQSVDLTTTDQQIALPGGRHWLSFKKFNLQLFRKRVELDSCTITAQAKDSGRSSYKIFFKKLLLIGVDFDAMYRKNLIRADSVYCENPLFDINLNRLDAVSKKRDKPDPAKIVRELTGYLDLAFIGVKNAGIHIDISGSKNRTLFNSNKDNFEMRGLRVSADSLKPVTVERFDMLVRDYHLYNEDSSTIYNFDSVHFVNSKIVLNNFTVATTSDRRDLKDFNIPYFELTGIDWYELLFEQRVKAQEAVLINPVINYTKRTPSRKNKKANLFELMENIGSLLNLNRINIFNGNVNIKLAGSNSFNLTNTNLVLYSNDLLHTAFQQGLRRAIDHFSFSDGTIKLKDITAQLQNVSYTGDNLLHADKLLINSSNNKIKASMNDVIIDNMLLDEKAETIIADGFKWKNATLFIQAVPAGKKGDRNNKAFSIKNIYGNNTRLKLIDDKASITTFLRSIKISSIYKSGNRPLKVNGLLIDGNNLFVRNGFMQVKSAAYQLADNKASYFSGLNVNRIHEQDSLSIQSPRINFSPDINAILANDIHFNSMQALAPVIRISKMNKEDSATGLAKEKTIVRLDKLTANQPDIKITSYNNDTLTISLPKTTDNIINAAGIKINGDDMQMRSFSLNTTSALLKKSSGQVSGVEDGKIELDLSDLTYSKKDGKPFWRLLVNNLDVTNAYSFSTEKSKSNLQLQQASLGNVNLSSAYISSLDQLVKNNSSAWLKTVTGQYIDSSATLKWYNANYNYNQKTLGVDSFFYCPTQSKDFIITNTPHQTDYTTLNTGAIRFTDFDLEKYNRDSTLFAQSLDITNPQITIYRDMQPPFLSGIIKPLPVNMIKKIALPLWINKVNIINGRLSYTEKNEKTRAEGTVLLTRMYGDIGNIKNRDFSTDDSLSLVLNAYLMDSASVNLRVKESYTDSLSGFLMTLRMKPTSLTFLNPLLAPMSNIKITSGIIDSFHLRAVGKEQLSLGKMNMYYHDLKIKLVSGGDQHKTTF